MSVSTLEPALGFSHFEFCTAIRRGIEAAGYLDPRPIQEQAIPAALEGRDILGLAQTGTGKTAAFALPIMERLHDDRLRGPRVLVVAPTRELAIQISDDFKELGKFMKIKVATLFGGVSASKQLAALRERPDVLVACPGRLLDLYRQGFVPLDKIETLVLDEADHMFDMGFLPDIRRILNAVPEKRQTMLFSATMPKEIRSLAEDTLYRPHRVELAHSQPASTIEHALYPVDEKRKLDLLNHLLQGDDFVSAIVFTRTKHRGQEAGTETREKRHQRRGVAGQHVPERPRACDARFPRPNVRRTGRHRHRSPRSGHRTGLACDQLRHPEHTGCLHTPHRSYRSCRTRRSCVYICNGQRPADGTARRTTDQSGDRASSSARFRTAGSAR